MSMALVSINKYIAGCYTLCVFSSGYCYIHSPLRCSPIARTHMQQAYSV